MRYFTIILLILLYGCYEGFDKGTDFTSLSKAKFVKSVVLYPNPINSGEKISLYYDLSDTCIVNIKILNITGDMIKNVVNNDRQAQGKHDIDIQTDNQDAETLKSGIYILQIQLESKENKIIPFEIR